MRTSKIHKRIISTLGRGPPCVAAGNPSIKIEVHKKMVLKLSKPFRIMGMVNQRCGSCVAHFSKYTYRIPTRPTVVHSSFSLQLEPAHVLYSSSTTYHMLRKRRQVDVKNLHGFATLWIFFASESSLKIIPVDNISSAKIDNSNKFLTITQYFLFIIYGVRPL